MHIGGGVVSIELRRGGRAVFSVQVAERDVELAPPDTATSPWSPVAVESLVDNLGSKMTALVVRGAPRDFIDARAAVDAGVVSVAELWHIWLRKHPGLDVELAKLEAGRRLAGIELRRPLAVLAEPERSTTAAARTWYKETLLRASAEDADASPDGGSTP